ncbi:hypothetical protein ACFSQQ_27905 [Mesorhizobium kowhaii]|uniref:hypothetical protein n=1 Tax=Mesorhizobium kowhaii TaxID=1300272 RepID=UPI0035E52628
MSKVSDMVRTEVMRLSPYNSGLTIGEVMQRYAPARIAKLGSNENPLGRSPTLAMWPAASTLTVMGLATALVASAVFSPQIESNVLRIIGG